MNSSLLRDVVMASKADYVQFVAQVDMFWLVAGLAGAAQAGRGVCDLKPDNLRVHVADDGTFLRCTVLDLGGSVIYQGKTSQEEL